MAQTIKDLIELNRKSIKELETFKSALRDGMVGLPTARKFAVLSTISDIDLRLRALHFTQAHLEAAGDVVQFSDEDAKALEALGRDLDKQIAAGAQINAVLADLPAVLNAAAGLDGLINGHIHS